MKPAFIFLFLICGGEAPCYQDVVIARTCAQAEAMARLHPALMIKDIVCSGGKK